MDCVACIVVDGELWLASNSQTINEDDLVELKKELGDATPVWIVTNGERNVMHAEMQLVSQLSQEGKMCNPLYIGVSKPCCVHCCNVLDQLGIKYANWHNCDIKNWQNPFS